MNSSGWKVIAKERNLKKIRKVIDLRDFKENHKKKIEKNPFKALEHFENPLKEHVMKYRIGDKRILCAIHSSDKEVELLMAQKRHKTYKKFRLKDLKQRILNLSPKKILFFKV